MTPAASSAIVASNGNSSIKQPAIAGYFSTALASISLDPLQRMFGKIPEDTP
jgi:hypothetical protein